MSAASSSSPLSLLQFIFDDIVHSGTMKVWKHFIYSRYINALKRSSLLYLLVYGCILSIDIILRGISQVFLCDHTISGIFICIGLAFTSYDLLLYAIIGTAFSTMGAYVIATPPTNDILSGLCGYDGALVGCACWAFFLNDSSNNTMAVAILLSFVTGFVHVACSNLLKTFNLPTFTLAFNLCTMCLLLSIKMNESGVIEFKPPSSSPQSLLISDDSVTLTLHFFIDASIKGVGQFMFCDTLIGSSFVLLGIFISSRLGALAAWTGATTACIVSFYILQVPKSDILNNVYTGLYGYNSAGACAAIAGGVFFKHTKMNFLVGVTAAALGTLILLASTAIFGGLFSLPVLTFPFITTTWIIMLTQSKHLVDRDHIDDYVNDDSITGSIAKRSNSSSYTYTRLKSKLLSIFSRSCAWSQLFDNDSDYINSNTSTLVAEGVDLLDIKEHGDIQFIKNNQFDTIDAYHNSAGDNDDDSIISNSLHMTTNRSSNFDTSVHSMRIRNSTSRSNQISISEHGNINFNGADTSVGGGGGGISKSTSSSSLSKRVHSMSLDYDTIQ